MNGPAATALAATARLALQIGLLVGLDQLARVLSPHLPLALPSNLVGMLLLSLLLSTGLVREAWIGTGAGLFNRHLAFFFVPIAVGLLAYAALLREHGLALLLVIGLSTAAGIAAAGWIGSWRSSPAKPMASP
ncbi:CidA/LrgA family protein [Synechococcus sp. CS-1328]|uniref:CidA/LrgA family protein n=1 Tax=Synechococcus sp. CS-1328 TaxID=2847976 RepID=UPI00223AFDB8|nr:CidA/LrgA family protein [Synechococcus sp. CS-1328]MCT0224760.1 CidA/LrgA family protein [Synechococcus sp. CS-1328]